MQGDLTDLYAANIKKDQERMGKLWQKRKEQMSLANRSQSPTSSSVRSLGDLALYFRMRKKKLVKDQRLEQKKLKVERLQREREENWQSISTNKAQEKVCAPSHVRCHRV
jgi:hypothetical protein